MTLVLPAPSSEPAPPPVPAPAQAPPPLEVDEVSVHFGGLRALDRVSLRVDHGEIVGLIGGNGAGKTTLMDCISGYVRPVDGRIRSFGQDLLGLAPALRPYLGVGRSYQDARLFPGLTVAEALLVSYERHHPTGLLGALLGLPSAGRVERAKRERMEELVDAMGLTPYREKRVSELSTGTRRVVDLATILAQEPGLLLLDEPTAGLAQRETEAFGPLLRRLQDRIGCAILIIEHDIVLVTEVSNRVYALESGSVIAEGAPLAVRSDPRVVASYLGTDESAIRRSGARTGPPRAPGSAGSRRARRSAPLRPSLGQLTREELLARAAIAGVRGRHRMRKHELVAALEEAR